MALGKGLDSLIPQKKKVTAVMANKPAVLDEPSTAKAAEQQDRSVPPKTTVESPVAPPPAEPAVSKHERIHQIPLTNIVPNPEQPRKHFGHSELEELIASIKEHGVLQPVVVTEKDDGSYELIAGERRFRASQMAGMLTVPAIVKEADDQTKLELALIENIQRQNLNPIEEAFSYKRLMDKFGLTQQEVSQKVGKSRPAVANTIRLLDLPEQIQEALISGQLSTGKARALLSVKDEQEQLKLFADMLGKTIATVRDAERAVHAQHPKSRKGSVRRDPNILAQEQLLEERFGTKSRITQKGERGTIILDYYSKEELKELLGRLLES